MNSLLKKVLAINLAMLVLLLPLFTRAQTPRPRTGKVFLGYGVESDPVVQIPNKLRPRSAIPPGTGVKQILKSLDAFSHAGGIMFDQVGQPCNALAEVGLRLSYNPQQPDGRRLTLNVGTRAFAVGGVRDSDLQPIAMFANSANPIVANLQHPDGAITEACPVPSRKLEVVTLHPAFENRQLGWLMTRMDSVPWSITVGSRWDNDEPLPEETRGLSASLLKSLLNDEADFEANILPSMPATFLNSGPRVLTEMTPQARKRYSDQVTLLTQKGHDWKREEAEIREFGIDMSVWNRLTVEDRKILLVMLEPFSNERFFDERISNINDDETPPTFCTQASTVKLGGLPNLQFLAPYLPENYVLPKSSKLMTESLPELRLVDQEAYDGMIRIYRLAGLFRYIKKQSPPHWQQFLTTLPRPERQDTYAILCPSCPADAVRKWVACVDKNFPG